MGLKLWDALYEGTGLEIESWNAHQVSPEHCGLGETECKQPSFSSMDTTIWLLVFDFAVHASALSESSATRQQRLRRRGYAEKVALHVQCAIERLLCLCKVRYSQAVGDGKPGTDIVEEAAAHML
eukprot:1560175-Rhodomonas_salina.2